MTGHTRVLRWMVVLLFVLSVLGGSASAARRDRGFTGVVQTPDGRPLAGALVRLSAMPTTSSTKPFADPVIAETLTDAAGRFVVSITPRRELIRLARFHNGALNMQLDVVGVDSASSAAATNDRNALGMKVLGTTGTARTVLALSLALSTPALAIGEIGRGLALQSGNLGVLTTAQVKDVTVDNTKHYSSEIQQTLQDGQYPSGYQPCSYGNWVKIADLDLAGA